jgi:predicted ATPase
MIRVIALGLNYDEHLLKTAVGNRDLVMYPENGLHPVEQIELCKEMAKYKGELVIATHSTYIIEYFDTIKTDNAHLYLLSENSLLYSNDRNIHETYRSLSEKAYNMIDSVKE